MSIIICICNILICISAAISALYWFASSCVKIVEPGNYIYNDSPKAKDYENFFQKNTCDNKPKKVIYNCIHETFIQCFYGTYKDLYSFFSDYSIAHFFSFS